MVEPTIKLADLSILDEDERHQIVTEWNATDVSFAEAAQPVHELFAAQAAATPDACAIVDCGEGAALPLTYGQLDARANQLAHRLHAEGITVGTLVGVAVPPSAERLIAVLGILKAGGAYVPLDAAYPLERL